MTPNTADYFGRGWCFCESSVSNLVKDYDFVLNLGQYTGTKERLRDLIRECAARRAPPLTPAAFRAALATKAFTSKKADEEMVARLYADTFAERMGAVAELRYDNLQWGDADAAALGEALASGALRSLEHLSLSGNGIGDEGAAALGEALASGALPSLEVLNLSYNGIGDVGMAALAAAVASGAAPKLEAVYLDGNPGDSAPVDEAVRELQARRA